MRAEMMVAPRGIVILLKRMPVHELSADLPVPTHIGARFNWNCLSSWFTSSEEAAGCRVIFWIVGAAGVGVAGARVGADGATGMIFQTKVSETGGLKPSLTVAVTSMLTALGSTVPVI